MNELREIPIDKIHVPQVRVSSILDQEQKALLNSTIREVGILQEPVVRQRHDGEYELIAGQSRIRTLQEQGQEQVLVKIIQADEKLSLIMNVAENVARGSYDYISVAQAIRRLKEMGVTPEQLERIFPWKERWIQFIEGLQDLPEDLHEGIRTRKITPSHVREAVKLPTPEESHSALQTAIRLEWDSAILKTFVENRLEQFEIAKARAKETGDPVQVPEAQPQQLIQYKQCLICGYQRPRDQVTMYQVCDPCRELVAYITSQLGPAENAMDTVFAALKAYYGQSGP